MITLTQPHTIEDKLTDILEKHKVAMKNFKAGKQFTLFTRRTGCIGKIRSSECTYSHINGWHWHVHELWIVDENCDIEAETEFLKKKWLNACLNAGFIIAKPKAFNEVSVNIIDNAHSSDYLAKLGLHWGADKELTGGASKKGHGKNPFDLANSNFTADKLLFLEYLQATKGKAQIYWSPGLKALVGVEDKTDKELVEEQTEYAELIAFLEREMWRTILRNGERATVLEVVEKYGFSGLRDWLYNYGFMLFGPSG